MTQLRRVITPELSTLLRTSRKLQAADLYTITMAGGQVLRWTAHDQSVTIGSETWVRGPGLSRDEMTFAVGVESQAMSLQVAADQSIQVNGTPLLAFLLSGGFDGAEVRAFTAFRAELGDAEWVGKLEQFSGRVSDVESSARMKVQVTVRSVLEAFNQPIPPTVYQPQCRNTLYDENCQVPRAPNEYGGTVAVASSGGRLVFGHSLLLGAGFFDLGSVKMLTGANAGVSRTIRTYSTTQVTVLQPWPHPVAVGDSFAIYRGCDLTMATCVNRFDNLQGFRGFPYIPPPETVT